MIILDTNVVSAMLAGTSHPAVMSWLDGQSGRQVGITAITAAELLFGVAVLPQGRRRSALDRAVRDALEALGEALPFSGEAARYYAERVARARSNGYQVSTADGFIAAIAAAHGATVATRDVAPFEACGVPVVNPWNAG